MQEVFVRFITRFPEPPTDMNVGAYLHATAKNTLWKQLRDSHETSDGDIETTVGADDDLDNDPERSALLVEQRSLVRRCAAVLTGRQRRALTLRDVEGYSYEEIGSELGIGPGAVMAVISRARARLRVAVRRANVDLDTLAPECKAMLGPLSDYLDGRAVSTEVELESHLATCDACCQTLASFQEAGSRLRGFLPLVPLGGMLSRLRGGRTAQARRSTAQPPPRRPTAPRSRGSGTRSDRAATVRWEPPAPRSSRPLPSSRSRAEAWSSRSTSARDPATRWCRPRQGIPRPHAGTIVPAPASSTRAAAPLGQPPRRPSVHAPGRADGARGGGDPVRARRGSPPAPSRRLRAQRRASARPQRTRDRRREPRRPPARLPSTLRSPRRRSRLRSPGFPSSRRSSRCRPTKVAGGRGAGGHRTRADDAGGHGPSVTTPSVPTTPVIPPVHVPAVPLATTASFAVLAGAGVTNTGPSVLTGDLGSFPTPSITGLASLTLAGLNQGGGAAAQQAKADLVSAHDAAAAKTPSETIAADLGGRTLAPGVYRAASSIGITGALTLDGRGDPDAVFVFQAGSTLTTASGSQVLLVNGARSCNVFWQVGSSATLGTGSSFRGSILALTSVTVTTGVAIDGRVLARNGAVTLDTDTIARSSC